ncbi:MAG: folate-binding protein YgfZ [Magnetococcales bacterium]|nr:folate-binding protein YgfZ [Magnetococcales bacterium]
MSLLQSLLKMGIPWISDRGKETPLHFGDPVAEKQGIMDRSALVDFSHRGTVVLAGDERVSFLGGLVTNQVKDLKTDRCIYTAMLSPQGRFQRDFTLIDHGTEIYFDTEPEVAADLVTALNFYRLRSKVEIRDQSTLWGILGVVGPTAGASLAAVFPGIDLDAVPLGTVWIPERDLRLWRDPRHPAFGYRIQCSAAGFVDLWQRLRSGIPAAGFAAWEAYRIRHALPRGGSEWIPGETLLLEAGGLELNAVSFQKGCYVGQETTARTHHRGTLKRRLFHVTINGQETVPPMTPVLLSSGKEAGVVTSAVANDDGCQGLAVLRLSDVASTLTALGRPVTAKRPEWASWE